jgi:type II secretory pathway pseudopilin PulG
MIRTRGLTLVEAVCVSALIGIAALAIVPSGVQIVNGGRVAAASRDIALSFHALRWKSVARRTAHGMWFTEGPEGWSWHEVRDGNGNGLRTAEVRNGTDPILSGPHRVEDRVAGVRPGFPGPGPYPRIGRHGRLDALHDPIKFGRSNLIAFSPRGSSSSGTLYLTDGAEGLYGIVLFGPTTRVRVWRYDPRQGRWRW